MPLLFRYDDYICSHLAVPHGKGIAPIVLVGDVDRVFLLISDGTLAYLTALDGLGCDSDSAA